MGDGDLRIGPLARLLRLGAPGGPSHEEASELFAALRTTPDEGRAVQALLELEARTRLPEPLLLPLARALVDRGEEPTATCLLVRSGSTGALNLHADLLHRAGDVIGAIAQIERVLLRDVDYPGARERLGRWRQSLGRPAAHEPEAGSTLALPTPEAPFQLVREVARGGAGVVYEAEDRDLGRRVALKVYHRPEADRAQLLHEARVAVALAGEGIVRVFDVDPDRGWLAMEWAPHGALRLALGSACAAPVGAWARPLARALARIHVAGWVHHDVKPANVLLRAPDVPLLSDFGTARRFGEPSPPGSLGYVSPERLAGRASDPRDDVYGFGRVLEDALAALPGATESWSALASRCTGLDAGRPRDGIELSTILDDSAGRQDAAGR